MIMEDLFHYMENEEEDSDLYLPWPSSTDRSVSGDRSFTYSRSPSCCSDFAPDEKLMKENVELNDSPEMARVKERFAKLLLAEDMSGCGKGVTTAVAISNSITNLYATVFGHSLRLEPLDQKKKVMWKREMECLLAVCDHMVEFISLDLTKAQDDDSPKMARAKISSRPRTDICINLPALQKLDSILLEILDSFADKEFCYVEDGSVSMSSNRSGSFRKVVHRNEDKWWVPVPCVPSEGLSEDSRKHLRNKRECANQVQKAAMAINSSILAEMEIPSSYSAALPKSGKASMSDSVYKYLNGPGDGFSPDEALDNVSIKSEHEALELADQIEASVHTWRRKASVLSGKSSWNVMKDVEKNRTLADRAEHVLFRLKQRFPEMSQTSLDTSKIQENKVSEFIDLFLFNCFKHPSGIETEDFMSGFGEGDFGELLESDRRAWIQHCFMD